MPNLTRDTDNRQEFPGGTNPTKKTVVVDGQPYEVHVLAPFRGRPKPEYMTIRHRGQAWQRWQRKMRGRR